MCYSSQEVEEALYPNADNPETLQAEAAAVPAPHPWSRLLQESPGLHGHCRTRAHRVSQYKYFKRIVLTSSISGTKLSK